MMWLRLDDSRETSEVVGYIHSRREARADSSATYICLLFGLLEYHLGLERYYCPQPQHIPLHFYSLPHRV